MEIFNGEYRILEEKQIESAALEVYKIEHLPTGMSIIYVRTNDNNKVFLSAFSTPPFDNSGAPHILEHSVLCGSQKYKAKDLFNELMKGSVNTFLNAMTFSDKTIYPVASKNHKDFYNLMDVYLDSVFNPRISETPEFFRQEGWNYGIARKSDTIEIRGIVYNEMKGAYDSPERLLIKKIDEAIYKNTPYEYDSGGVPCAIPSLTYERLLEFYNVFYSPSNSLLYLYGDLDINKALDMISEAVKGRGKTPVPKINLKPRIQQNSVEPHKGFYSVSEKKENGAYFAVSFPACDYNDYYTSSALEIHNYILAGNHAAPLRSAMCKSGICGDFSSYYRASSYTTSFSFVGKSCKDGKFNEYKRLLSETLIKISETPIEKELIDAALNKWEFFVNEEDYGNRPRGLHYGILAASAWVYGGNIYSAMNIKKTLSKIREEAYNGLFDSLLKKYLVENGSVYDTILEPEEGLLQKEEAELKERLAILKGNLSEQELSELIKQSKALDAFRKKPAAKRFLNKIPSLSIGDIPREIQSINCEYDNNNVLYIHDKQGIEYINLYFDLRRVPAELIPYCGLLCEFLGKTDTPSYSAERIINELNVYAGGVRYSADAQQNTDGSCFPRLCIKIKALDKNVKTVLGLISEVMAPKPDISDIKRITGETLLKMESNFLANGHTYSIARALSYIFPYSNYTDLLSGIGFYNEICNRTAEELEKKLHEAAEAVFKADNLTFGIATDGAGQGAKEVDELKRLLPTGSGKPITLGSNHSFNEGFVFDGGICFNASAFNLYDAADRYSGKLLAAKSILNLDYLWPEIRNKRGAYGCGCSFGREGSIFFYSYRDPELAETYETFNNSFRALSEYKTGEKEFQRYIINAIKPFEKPYKPHEALELAVSNRLLGITEQMRQLERDEILSATQEEINEIGDTLSRLCGKGVICSIGEKSKIESGGAFDCVKSLRKSIKEFEK